MSDMTKRVEDLQAQANKGLKAANARDAILPWLELSRAALIEAWTREPDEKLRHEAWHAVRAHDALKKRIDNDIATGRAAADELRFLAAQKEDKS